MRKVISFSKAFVPSVIISGVLIVFGLVGLFTRGINYGLDFQAGFIEKVRIAPTAFSLTYTGSKSVTVEQSANGIDFVITSVGDDNLTRSFRYAEVSTVGAFRSAVASIEGLSVVAEAPDSVALASVFPDSQAFSRLSAVPYRFHYIPSDIAPISSDDVRDAVSGTFPDAAVQVLGAEADRFFQIRLSDDGTDPDASVTLFKGLNKTLSDAFGEENIAVISSDFVGSRLSSSLARQSVWLVLTTLVLIWGYAAIRFRWDFALGAILAILHDAIIMVSFIVWTQMQFNATTLAAILTILGYSINDTVVIFDRIRENMKFHPEMKITELLNFSQTEMLGRSIITTVTTMLAVLSLYIFTSGDMKDFALALLVGMVSGVYSTIFIASAFINFVGKFRKDGGRIPEKKAKPVLSNSGELV
ncbi:MAG: protein translocase subunit SecF [Treponema sp.]|nr:MAG: protein translocase subunit SecF [Treponema sp.]